MGYEGGFCREPLCLASHLDPGLLPRMVPPWEKGGPQGHSFWTSARAAITDRSLRNRGRDTAPGWAPHCPPKPLRQHLPGVPALPASCPAHAPSPTLCDWWSCLLQHHLPAPPSPQRFSLLVSPLEHKPLGAQPHPSTPVFPSPEQSLTHCDDQTGPRGRLIAHSALKAEVWEPR